MSWYDVAKSFIVNVGDKEKEVEVKELSDEYSAEELSQYPYFAYGSNLYASQMSQRCPGAKVVRKAYLPNYKLMFRGVADVTKRKGARAEGILFDVTEEHVRSLHKFEGYPFKYKVVVGKVIVDGREIDAFWYEIKSKDDNLSKAPSGLYFAKIASGYAAFGLNSDTLYHAIRRVQNTVTARQRKVKLLWEEQECIYDKVTWMDEHNMLGLVHSNVQD